MVAVHFFISECSLEKAAHKKQLAKTLSKTTAKHINDTGFYVRICCCHFADDYFYYPYQTRYVVPLPQPLRYYH